MRCRPRCRPRRASSRRALRADTSVARPAHGVLPNRRQVIPASAIIEVARPTCVQTYISVKELIPTALKYDPHNKVTSNCVIAGVCPPGSLLTSMLSSRYTAPVRGAVDPARLVYWSPLPGCRRARRNRRPWHRYACRHGGHGRLAPALHDLIAAARRARAGQHVAACRALARASPAAERNAPGRRKHRSENVAVLLGRFSALCRARWLRRIHLSGGTCVTRCGLRARCTPRTVVMVPWHAGHSRRERSIVDEVCEHRSACRAGRSVRPSGAACAL